MDMDLFAAAHVVRPVVPSRFGTFPTSYRVISTSVCIHYQVKASQMEVAGSDSDGREFKNARCGGNKPVTITRRPNGIAKALPTGKEGRGGIGGWSFGWIWRVNDADVKGSEAFLQTLFSECFVDGGIDRHLVALDCGSGIGRITKNLLLRYFNEVDLLEPVSHFLDVARESLVYENHMASDTHKATNFFCTPLQEFTPAAGRYDVIWVQWCIGHLTDDDFFHFSREQRIYLDKEDRSITRSDVFFKELFCRVT
ncbi:hypothetical protein GH714_016658 [Hevea brasiliensis]|uniref:Alpha N-terminal protein methyltransferase 1 n=1 Tax=Hevea brasiliensis TaxID=3981 RepID=A0A6A6MER1_HEVBR|nr:hypothetical protein GH714_016658 [Hevea brasiliensis]